MWMVHILLHAISAVVIAFLLHSINEDQDMGAIVMQRSITKETLKEINSSKKFSSSVWCIKDQPCHLKNACYKSDTNEFLVFTDADSVLDLPGNFSSYVTVDLSSIRDHNSLVANLVFLPMELHSKFKMKWRRETSLAFRRFLPGNLMHVFHDDILPLHHTLKFITLRQKSNSKLPFDVQLILMEKNDEPDPEIDAFYQYFTNYSLIFFSQNKLISHLECFEDLYLGLSRSTTWYDFGFTKPQGPVNNLKVTSMNIHNTVDFIVDNINVRNIDMSDYIVFVTRRENRKILNEMDLTLSIIEQLRFKVVTLSLETHTLQDLIMWTRSSKGIIGMHGSLLILSLFLKPGSFLIELFPFAVNPDHYTPYKMLSGIIGMDIVYKSWVNKDQTKTVGHPERPAEVGGLDHLSETERETILSQTEVPTHICCSDPSWLYHIYQDTTVNTGKVTALIKSAVVTAAKLGSHASIINTVYPNRVSSIQCLKYTELSDTDVTIEHTYLTLHWSLPWVVGLLADQQNVEYDILIKEINSGNVRSLTTMSTSHTELVDSVGLYYVWVRCLLNGNEGPYSDALLCEDD